MKATNEINIETFNNYIKVIPTPEEAVEIQRLMEKIKLAQLDFMFKGDTKVLKVLNYKADIKLDDGRILTNAWPKELTLTNHGYEAIYQFDSIIKGEAK